MREQVLIVPYQGDSFVTLNLLDTDENDISRFKRIFISAHHYADLRSKLRNDLPQHRNQILVYSRKLSSKHKWTFTGVVSGDIQSLATQVNNNSQAVFKGTLGFKEFIRYLP